MTMTLIVVFVLVLAIGLFLASGIKIVQQSERVVIERLGSYNRTLQPGINLIVPFIDKARSVKMRRYRSAGIVSGGELEQRMVEETKIDIRETVLDFPSQPVVTNDNVSVSINGALYFQIVDPQKAVYEVENLTQAIEILAKTTLRSEIGKTELDKLFESRDEINQKLAAVMDEAGDKWGVKVSRVEIQDIEIPNDIQQSMHTQMAAERQRRATVTEANGEREAEIARAEGEKRAAILRAEGQQQAIETVLRAGQGGGLEAKDVVSYLLGLQYLETLPNIAKDGERVLLPYEATAFLGTIEAIRDVGGISPLVTKPGK
jgi:regulator of protease activity HflC (stomatin/prohibitin superfamily)